MKITEIEMPENQQNMGLSRLIGDTYGSPEELAECLDLGVEMLFYLEEDTFERKDVHKVVSALRHIMVILRDTE